MKKTLIVLGILTVGVASYFGYDSLYGTFEESFVCGRDGEVQTTFVVANWDSSILSCHACSDSNCNVGTVLQCEAARLTVGRMTTSGKCKQL